MREFEKSPLPNDPSYFDASQETYVMKDSPMDYSEHEKYQDRYIGGVPTHLGYDSNIMYNDGFNSPYQISVNPCGSNTKDRCSSKGSVYVPKHPKVFARRIQGRKSDHNNNLSYFPSHKCYDSQSNRTGSNGKHSVKRGSNNIVKGSGGYRNYTESTKLFPSPLKPSSNVRKLYASMGDIHESSLLDVPLCVQEVGTNIQPYHKFMPMHSLNQDEYYLNHYIGNHPGTVLKPSPEKLVRVVQILLKCICKTVRLVIEKIRKEFDTREIVGADYRIPSLPNLDIACDVCEKTEEDRIRLNRNKNDTFRYFEEPDTTPKFIKKLWGTLNDWIDMNEKNPIVFERRMDKQMDTEVFYKVGPFPKDENGKVELPEFEKIEKKN